MSVAKKLKKCVTRLLMFTSRSTRANSQRSSLNTSGVEANAAGFIDSTSGIGQPSVVHALVVIFLEFFAWGLLTIPNINVLNRAFPQHAFLMNGLIMGVKGFLSFLSAPLVGTLSDTWGRKTFLLLTVFFTCMPIPFMAIAPSDWYFVVVSLSGLFGVTFSVIFAFVADVTDESERSTAYGLVSATFAASLVTSPALGAYMSEAYGDIAVVALATAVALLDFLFIFFVVPESLPKELRITPAATAIDGSTKAVIPATAGGIDWTQVDPFSSLKKVGSDRTIMLTSLTVFLSYLPEAGQYSCIFVYLKLIIGFSAEQVSIFLAVIGLLSVLSQTLILSLLMKKLGSRQTILVGLFFQALQLAWFGIGREHWMMYGAGVLAAVSSITYPAISAHVSNYASHDQQGLAQGVLTGVRGLCNGFGPALYGTIFYMFHVDLTETATAVVVTSNFNHGLFRNQSGRKHAGVSYHDELHFYGGTSGMPFTKKSRKTLHDLHAVFNSSMPNITTWTNSTNATSNNSVSSHFMGDVVYHNSTLMPSNQTDFIGPPAGAIPGPAFVVGAMFVLLAIAAASFMPDVLDSLTHGELYSALSRYSSVREFDFDYDERNSSNGAEKNEIIFYAATGRSMSMAAASTRRQPSRKKRRRQPSHVLHQQKSEPRVHIQREYKGSYSAVDASINRSRHRRRTSDEYSHSSISSSGDAGTLDGISIDEGEVFFSAGAGSAADETSLYGYDDTIQSVDMIPHSSSSAPLVAPHHSVATQQAAPTAKRWQFPGSVMETTRK